MKRMKRLHGVTLLVIAAAAIAAGVWFLNGGPGEPAAQTAAAGSGQAAGGAQAAALAEPPREGAVRVARDAAGLPPPVGDRPPRTVVVELTAVELDGQLMDGITYTYWTFNGTVPGPMIRVREGDTVELRLTNAPGNIHPHSIDLHAVNGPHGGGSATQVLPGETKAFRFKALNPGLYIYHCATPYVPAHIANGMYGLILVEPAGGLEPVDREYYIVQGEFYTDLRPYQKGHAQFHAEAMWQEIPNFVVFNGQFNALTGDHRLTARVGERVRLFIGNAGPNLASSVHVIGEIFDVVHKEAASEAATNIQTTLIPAGGAAWVEFTVDVPGEYTLVDHAINRALGKGAVATLYVEGPENPEIFEPLDPEG
ncbi:MAG: copper-containing nitrite reductase [Clostridia bacterium]